MKPVLSPATPRIPAVPPVLEQRLPHDQHAAISFPYCPTAALYRSLTLCHPFHVISFHHVSPIFPPSPPSILCPNWTMWVSSTSSTSPSSKETNGWTLRRADLLDFGPSQAVYRNGFVQKSVMAFEKSHLLPGGPSIKSTACMFGSKLPSI